jgi:hypothetical protein
MAKTRRGWKFKLATFVLGLLGVTVSAAIIWRDDLIKALLDPKVPFVKSRPPDAPKYDTVGAWAMLPSDIGAAVRSAPADVFFIHPTTYNGGKHWNGPILDPGANAVLMRVMAPNYAAPFASVGEVFIPRYRQASLYTKSTLWDDAIDARRFAYGDVKAAFDYYRDHDNGGRPFVLVGVEQGGELGARLLREEIDADPDLRSRLVAAYLIDAVIPADDFGPGAPTQPCRQRQEAGCLVAYTAVRRGDFGAAVRLLARAMVWNPRGQLVPLGGRTLVCVNPLLGAASEADAPARLNLGAAAATGLEWGVRPGFLVRQVGAQCEGGILRVTKPRSTLLRPSGNWIERVRAPGFNLFWGDLEADAQARLAAWQAAHPAAPPAPGRQSKSS